MTRKSDTRPQQGDRQQRSPRAPHERDESADSQAQDAPSQQPKGKAAREDVERGLPDTDRGPVLREIRDKKL
jgi:hypothetical protein